MKHIAAASGAFIAFGLISCMLIVKRIWTCHMEFALYKLIIYHYLFLFYFMLQLESWTVNLLNLACCMLVISMPL